MKIYKILTSSLCIALTSCGQQGINFTYINADAAQTERLDCMFNKVMDITAGDVSSDGAVTIVDYTTIIGMYQILTLIVGQIT